MPRAAGAGDDQARVAARIMTGAPMPYGADAVVPVEQTDAGMPVVTVVEPVRVGGSVRRAGDGVHQRGGGAQGGHGDGRPPGRAGRSRGRGRVVVHPRPRVVVLTTGSELVEPGRKLGPARSTTSTGSRSPSPPPSWGAGAYRVGPVPDDPGLLSGRAGGPARPRRPDRDHRRGECRSLRHRQGRALAAGRRRVRPGGDAAGNAAGVRPDRRGADLHAAGQPGQRLCRSRSSCGRCCGACWGRRRSSGRRWRPR